MGDLHHIHDSHRRVQRLIPWFLNGTLEEGEEALVRTHCEACGECRADVARERQLRDAVASLPADEDRGWAGLREKVLKRPPSAERTRGPYLRRPIALGWALAGQLAVAACLTVAFLGFAPEPEPEYRLLASPDAATAGNIIVLFAPDTSEAALRRTLQTVGGRIVDGPTASGAYILRVAEPERVSAIARLRAADEVALAEPLAPAAPR